MSRFDDKAFRRVWMREYREKWRALEQSGDPVALQRLEKRRALLRVSAKRYLERHYEKIGSKLYFRAAVRKARTRAKEFGLECDLTLEWADDAARRGVCAVTGLSFAFEPFRNGVAGPLMPSIDRIDNARGYTQDNCRFVVWAWNRFKGSDTDEVVMRIARAALSRHSCPIA